MQATMAALKLPPSTCNKKVATFSCLLLFVLLSPGALSHNAVTADEILTSTSGVTFGRSSGDLKYKIEFHPAKYPFHPDSGQEPVVIFNKKGHNYMCFLPIVEEPKTVRSTAQLNSSNAIIEADRRIKLKTPDELIDVLKGKCFYKERIYRSEIFIAEDWWSYEFCYQNHFWQFNVEDGKVVQEFVLGVFDPEATAAFNQNHSDISMLKDPLSKDASQRYHTHLYTNGTICDLTNQPRETEVRFVCSEPTVKISSVKEISTCKYVVTVQCPMLCKHPMFQQERPMWHTIHCNEMPGDIKEPSVEDGIKGTRIAVIAVDSDRYAT